MRIWLGKRFRLPVVGSLYAGVSMRAHTFKDPGERAAFWLGVVLAVIILVAVSRGVR